MVTGVKFKYVPLGNFTYHVIDNPHYIKDYLLHWIIREWRKDRQDFPDQPWIRQWMDVLPQMEFSLEVIRMATIQLRDDLMNYVAPGHSFCESLAERSRDMEESILRGSSIEPLLIDDRTTELMDGYTRHSVLKKYNAGNVYAYVGRTKNNA